MGIGSSVERDKVNNLEEDELKWNVARNRPGSFEDIHRNCLAVFPSVFTGLKVSFANKFCNHSQFFSSVLMDVRSTRGSNTFDFDYRWAGDRNSKETLSAHFFEAPIPASSKPSKQIIEDDDSGSPKLIQDLESGSKCTHGSLASSLRRFQARVGGDALQYLPKCLALNLKTILAEFTGNRYTLGFATRNVLLGDKKALIEAYPDALVARDLTEAEFQCLYRLSPLLDIGFQVRKIVDEDVCSLVNGRTWGLGIGARMYLNEGSLLSATLSGGEGNVYMRSQLSQDFQLALGYVHNSNEPDQSCAKVAVKFTDANGMTIKLAADTRGTITTNISKELSSFSLPFTLILAGICDAKTAFPKYQMGLGIEML